MSRIDSQGMTLALRARIVVARLHGAVGWAGWCGAALGAVALAVAATAWRAQAAVQAPVVEAVVPARAASAVEVAAPLPNRGELALLVTQVQRAVVSEGMAWTSAEYRISPATEREPMLLEIRCSLKGPYPKLRAVLTQWMAEVPGASLRDLSMSRPNADAAEVEAKATLGIYLLDTAPDARPAAGSP